MNKAQGECSVTYGYKNSANGIFSVTFGESNINNGADCITSGFGNTVANAGIGNCVFGRGNTVSFGGYVMGYNNSSSGFIIGANNQNGYPTGVNGILIGYGLSHRNQNGSFVVPSQVISIGKYNASTNLSSPIIIFGCGQDSSNPKNAIEINANSCKILNNLQLNVDSTEVNAITPAKNSPASADDMTLVTKSHLGATLPMTHLAGAITGLDETSFPLDFTSYWTAARASDANMRINLRINGSCYSKSLYNCLAVDGSFECYRSSYDSGTQTTTFSRYRFGWDYANKALNLTGSMSWEMSDAGAISNVTHGLTGLVITIYQIETY